ncbi:hypothetical protein B7R25_05655 [Subtercola boreus]|uniref:Uncharacterized protein n=1 Tax=Subtercola boreus TaxID=120213 RepID=A0A3E0WC75_9MICO|nr:hypothetical protein B7R24_05585 [Subtercola boreus]RFA22326.1 hypothetical protein B7R23_05530 [Subtercola boreus]RFA28189.1 hypothetical protein B7R25_05655 [Subtercola boreus]
MPHDEQPLTRRALRELERQKPRKQQKEDAKAADEGEAQRRAAEVASVDAPDPAAVPAAAEAPVVAASPAVAESPVVEPVVETPVVESPVVESPVGGAPAEVQPAAESPAGESAVPFAPSSAVAATPALSRRARRALSADHPLADSQPGSAQPADRSANPVTGPIIAEIIPETPPTDSIEIVDTGAVETVEPLAADPAPASGDPSDTSEVAVPVEELIVVDEAVDPDVASQEDEEFAEIDDTTAPEAVHVITIDENPSGPILSPLFPAPADREVTRVDPTDSSFDNLVASRGVGASNSVATTSALVLPSVPHHGDVGTALDETGEVIITGSIDLPMSLGSMGAAPADGLESSELDAYLDPDGDVGSDVAPVSATRAVSTHGSNSGLIAPPKRSRANAPVILLVIASTLAVGVVGLLVAVFAFRIF